MPWGATRLQTSTARDREAAFSGIAAAYILGISRAIGETMVVAIACRMQPNFTWDARAAQTSPPTSCRCRSATCRTAHGYQTIFAPA